MSELLFLASEAIAICLLNIGFAWTFKRRVQQWKEGYAVAAVSIPVPLLLLVGGVTWVASTPNQAPPNDVAGMLALGVALVVSFAVLFSVVSSFVIVRHLRGTARM